MKETYRNVTWRRRLDVNGYCGAGETKYTKVLTDGRTVVLNFPVVCPFSLSFLQSLFWIPKEHFGFYVCGLAKTYKAYPGDMTGLSRQCLYKDPTRRKSSMYKWEKRKWVLLKQINPLSFDRPKRIYTNIPLPFLVPLPKRGEKMLCVCSKKGGPA